MQSLLRIEIAAPMTVNNNVRVNLEELSVR